MKRLYANGWTGDIRALTHAGSRQLLSPNVPEQHVTGGVRERRDETAALSRYVML